MKQNKINIKGIEDYIKSLFIDDVTGHDWLHIDRVRNVAYHIAQTEKVSSMAVIEASSLLHEIFDYKMLLSKEKPSESDVARLLSDAGFLKKDVAKVIFIVNNCSWSRDYFERKKIKDIEIQIVKDADKLDSIGAVGIARTFLYGSANIRPAFVPKGSAKEFKTIEEYRLSKSDSTIHHMIERMVKVQATLYTTTAKRIGKERHDFTINFINHFIADWYRYV